MPNFVYLPAFSKRDLDHLIQHIEAIVFASQQPVKVSELLDAFERAFPDNELTRETVQEALKQIGEKYKGDQYGFEMRQIGGGYQFLTKAAHHELISIYLNQKARKRLSTAAMETLSIIAYKQPITKSEIEQIRGVNCDYTVHKLLEKELVTILGKKDAPGQPLLYGVSQAFLDYFGINSTEELPKLKDIAPKIENEIGEAEGIETTEGAEPAESTPATEESDVPVETDERAEEEATDTQAEVEAGESADPETDDPVSEESE